MRTPLAWLHLRHEKTRTAVAVAGVAFAVVLVLLQLGFAGSVRQTATQIYDALEFDVLLVSGRYVHFSQAGTIPRQRLYQAQSVRGVMAAAPLYTGFAPWRIPTSGRRRGIFVMGFHLGDPVFALEEVQSQTANLARPGAVLMDRRSRPEFGARTPGLKTDVGRTTITVEGEFTLGTGFGADGALITGDQTFLQALPHRSLDGVSLGLVRVAADETADAVADRLRQVLPQDTQVFTRAQMAAREREHWVHKTSVGVIFGLGVGIALVVGVAIVYQVLSSDIDNRLGEFATLKAIGYPPWFLGRVVLSQAWLLALAGFVPGLAAAVALYEVTNLVAHIPMDLGVGRILAVLGMALAMCSLSGLAALRKVQVLDPADLFR